MSDGQHGHALYSRRYFEAAQAWASWNKLTAADIHALRTEPDFEGQNVFFYANHPIRFVRVVGILVDIELRANGKFTILTIDDSSGACIDIKIDARQIMEDDGAEYPSNTVIDNVDVHAHLGLPTLYLDKQPLTIGAVLEFKGTMSVFRNIRQIELKRLFAIKDTNAEARAWAKTAEWKRDVLSKPWILTQTERDRIDARMQHEQRKALERQRRKRAWYRKHTAAEQARQERHEAKRLQKEARYNHGALRGSNIIVPPWE